MVGRLNNTVNKKRQKELNFMVRTGVPIPVLESRNIEGLDDLLYNDHFTVAELIESGLMRYIGRRSHELFVRPLCKFAIYVNEVRYLEPGEVIVLELGELGRREFVAWSGD